MDSSILWVLVIAWIVSCGYYMFKLIRIARGKGVSLVTLFTRNAKVPHSRTRKLFFNIIIATLLFVIAILIIFFVKSSS